jgi:hypothetical protein
VVRLFIVILKRLLLALKDLMCRANLLAFFAGMRNRAFGAHP